MKALKVSLVVLFVFLVRAHSEEVRYSCTLKIHCSQLHADQKTSFEYVSSPDKKEAKTVDLGVVRGRVFGPHYLSLYLFDTRKPNTIWTKAFSQTLINDLEVSLIIPEDSDHSMVANLSCLKNLD